MRKNIYLSLLVALPIAVVAQPTINNAYNYTAGATVKNIRCTDIGQGNAGANQTWDFTSLTPVGGSKDTTKYWYTAPTSAAPVTGANLVERNSDSFYVYIKKTAAQDEVLAIADSSANNYDLTIKYTNSILFFKRPLTFGMTFTDNFAEQYTVSGFTLKGSGTITVNVDGYGTLKLPNNQTYNNVLRVEIVQHQSDTSVFPPAVATMDVVRYLWFDANHISPLLRIDAVDITSDLVNSSTSAAEYLFSEHDPLSVANTPKQNLQLNSTFTGNNLNINGAFETGKNYTTEVYNLSGQKIFQNTFAGGKNKYAFDMNTSLPGSIYLVSVTEAGNPSVSAVIRVAKL
jgi:hypothetical protein